MFFRPPINYIGQVFRPPSEAQSLLIQMTVGCSHNKCTYCMMYRDKSFYVREFEAIKADLLIASEFFKKHNNNPRRIFLCDGDALAAPATLIHKVLDLINDLFPDLDRIGMYVTGSNVLEKSSEDLRLFAQKKLTIGYIGLESGAEEILKLIVKGNTQQEMIDACLKLKDNGWKSSVIAMLGVGGTKLSHLHIAQTAKVVSLTSPNFFSFLTTMALPGSPYKRAVDKKHIFPLTTRELLMEMREIIANINSSNKIILRVNHVSNMFPIAGVLPKDQGKVLKQVDSWIMQEPENIYPPLPDHY